MKALIWLLLVLSFSALAQVRVKENVKQQTTVVDEGNSKEETKSDNKKTPHAQSKGKESTAAKQ